MIDRPYNERNAGRKFSGRQRVQITLMLLPEDAKALKELANRSGWVTKLVEKKLAEKIKD